PARTPPARRHGRRARTLPRRERGRVRVLAWHPRAPGGSGPGGKCATGPAGAWARLFARAAGYLGTELLRDAAAPGRYLTIDRWASAADFERFEHEHRADYEALDARCIEWTEEETALGAFTVYARAT